MRKIDIKTSNQSLLNCCPEEILLWGQNTFRHEIALSSSFQTQSVALLHLVSIHCPGLPILFLDTTFHFPETLIYKNRLVKEFNLNVITVKPEPDFQLDQSREMLFRINPDLCCLHNKVEPMKRALRPYRALISGIRKSQTVHRQGLNHLELDSNGVYRIHPLLNWSNEELFSYIENHNLPKHPLYSLGYKSIGCQPCTRPVQPGESEHAGRWPESPKTECGLHVSLCSPEGKR